MSLVGWSGWQEDIWIGWQEGESVPQPSGGWFMRPLKRQEEADPQELESARTEADISPVVTPAETAPTHVVINPSAVEYNAAQVADIREEAAKEALEELRRLRAKKKKRQEDELLLLM